MGPRGLFLAEIIKLPVLTEAGKILQLLSLGVGENAFFYQDQHNNRRQDNGKFNEYPAAGQRGLPPHSAKDCVVLVSVDGLHFTSDIDPHRSYKFLLVQSCTWGEESFLVPEHLIKHEVAAYASRLRTCLKALYA